MTGAITRKKMRCILLLILFCSTSFVFSYDVNSHEFWDDWEHDNTIEETISQNIIKEALSIAELEAMATEKNPEHAFYLGLLYYYGYQKNIGMLLQRDHRKALEYFEQARSNPVLEPNIDYYIGMIHWNGYDKVSVNLNRAKYFLQKSGRPEALLILATISYKTPEEQLEWYTKLAYTGDWHAMLVVADWYEKGKSGEKNKSKAYYWYNMACLKDIEYACESLKKLKI